MSFGPNSNSRTALPDVTGATLFADGSSLGNPGPSGWGAVLQSSDGQTVELGGSQSHSTNNAMELTAVIEGLRCARRLGEARVRVFTDSKFIIDASTKWLKRWRTNGFQTADGNAVQHQALWLNLGELLDSLKVEFTHVPGHAGITGNERVDEIAVSFSKLRPVPLYSGTTAAYPRTLRVDLDELKTIAADRKKDPYYLSVVDGVIERHRTWAECDSRVKGKRGAKFKKVRSAHEEAQALSDWGVR